MPDPAELNPEIGGALYFEGVNLLVNKSSFVGGTGFKGEPSIYVLCFQCSSKCNHNRMPIQAKPGNVGGAINFSINLKWIDASHFFLHIHWESRQK